MPPAEAPVLEARAVTKRFGPSPVLRNVDLCLRQGDILLVLGQNGSGKTTLLRLLAGLLRPTAGSVHLHGADFQAGAVALRAGIGYLSHRSHLYDELTLRENLQFAARLFGLADRNAVVEEALVLARLDARADDRVGRLSRGMQQRAALARAFLHRPGVLLLDEPFTALDTRSAERIRGWLTDRAAERRAMVIVTHQPDTLWGLATRVGVLAGGQWAILEDRPNSLEEFLGRYRDVSHV